MGRTHVRNKALPFESVLQQRMQRRELLKGAAGIGAAGTVIGSLGVTGCTDGGRPSTALGFAAIPPSLEDYVTLPEGYAAHVVYALGDPLTADGAEYSNTGAETDFNERAGDHHDGMSYFPLPFDSENSSNGLLVLNHENITQQYLHPNGPTPGQRPAQEVRKEISAHGVSVVEIIRDGQTADVVRDSLFNRRITPLTPMRLSGPVAGSEFVATAYDPNGLTSRGTLNNCANGFTPWGTYLTCEENWHGYFKTDEASPGREISRYGVGDSSNYGWETAAGAPDEIESEFARWDLTPKAESPTQDYRNEANTFGWIVEIDPYDPSATPIKRTAMGRIRHEGCIPSRTLPGQPLAFYMGDDNRGDYIYKFVTTQAFQPGVSNGSMLDQGTLYVARFDANGRGAWLPLTLDDPALAAAFGSMAELLVNTRTAADIVGATPMDRPEWAAVNPRSGEVYMTLTNNKYRGVRDDQPVDAANPRSYDAGEGDPDLDGNDNGHIIRWREDGDRADSTQFTWDILLFGARPDAPADVNVSGLTMDNALSSPDGLWFDYRRPGSPLWIETDDGAMRDLTNNQVLAAVPGHVGDGKVTAIGDQITYVGAPLGTDLRRFLVGPKGCEITGITMTPDARSLFINIQHPGENGTLDEFESYWPHPNNDGTAAPIPGQRPRSATLMITRKDGGIIGE